MGSLPSSTNILEFNRKYCRQFEGTRSKFWVLGPIYITFEAYISTREGGIFREFAKSAK